MRKLQTVKTFNMTLDIKCLGKYLLKFIFLHMPAKLK